MNQIFKSKNLDDKIIEDLTKDILDKCEKIVEKNFNEIKIKYNNISKNDAYIISPRLLVNQKIKILVLIK